MTSTCRRRADGLVAVAIDTHAFGILRDAVAIDAAGGSGALGRMQVSDRTQRERDLAGFLGGIEQRSVALGEFERGARNR